MQKLRVGVIGMGVGRGHAREYQQHPHAEVVAITDTDPARLRQAGDELKVARTYADPRAMLRQERLDVVSVATPNRFHKPQTLAALRAGCHVLCEKPMAMNAAEARQMLAAARRAKRRIMVNFSYRFNPHSLALKREIESGALGDIYFARTVWLRRRGLPGFGGWFGRKAASGGGPLIDLGVHRLDLALWLMGYPRPRWVMAGAYDRIASDIARRQKKTYDVEDFAVALVRFENGAALELEASWAGHIRERELMETRLLGSKGGCVQRNLNEGYEFDSELYLERNGVQYDCKPHPPLPGGTSGMAHFIDCIIAGRPHLAPGEEGLAVMQILDAIYASAARGQPVRIRAGRTAA